MANPPQPRSRADFEIAIICALEAEADAVVVLFDKCWEDEGQRYGKAAGDANAYTPGVMGGHNVVLAHMPGIGKSDAASLAASFRSSFGRIQLALVVGICGGVSYRSDKDEALWLGDVIISDGLIQYDFGKQYPDKFIRKDTLNDNLGRPNREIRAFLAKLRGWHGKNRLTKKTCNDVSIVVKKLDITLPNTADDQLFKPSYRHKHQDASSCDVCAECKTKEDAVCKTALTSVCSALGCSEQELVRRRPSEDIIMPSIHFGLMASGDSVMKSGEHRDEISAREKVIGFEMEGAGVWDSFPCVVIKGICDYADSHKNKVWQKYAAATAASCAKAFLEDWVSAGQEQLESSR
jgi:nucleoside phosphorylase